MIKFAPFLRLSILGTSCSEILIYLLSICLSFLLPTASNNAGDHSNNPTSSASSAGSSIPNGAASTVSLPPARVTTTRTSSRTTGSQQDSTVASPTVEQPQPRTSTLDSNLVAPRGSSRLKEKGKVTYSARRGVIKPGKRSGDNGSDSQRPRKRAAL